MTFLKTLIRLSLVASLGSLGMASGSPSFAADDVPAETDMIHQCVVLGGTEIPQPPGSQITACCYDDPESVFQGCYICDEFGQDCLFEPATPDWEPGRRGAWLQMFQQYMPAEIVDPATPVVSPFAILRYMPAISPVLR